MRCKRQVTPYERLFETISVSPRYTFSTRGVTRREPHGYAIILRFQSSLTLRLGDVRPHLLQEVGRQVVLRGERADRDLADLLQLLVHLLRNAV